MTLTDKEKKEILTNLGIVDPLVEAFRVVSERSLENDTALLKLCEAMIERMRDMTNTLSEVLGFIDTLRMQNENLHNKVEALSEVYHTHFNDGVVKH